MVEIIILGNIYEKNIDTTMKKLIPKQPRRLWILVLPILQNLKVFNKEIRLKYSIIRIQLIIQSAKIKE